MIWIAGDHAGFALKNYLIDELTKHGYEVEDLGPLSHEPDDDYPDYMSKAAKNVADGPEGEIGIVICRNGVGVSVLANKYRGVRCALSWSPEHVKSARNDDNANMLALPADYLSKETALQITLAFLETPFSNAERHIRRLHKIYDYSSHS